VSDTKMLYHCGDNRMTRRYTTRSPPNYFVMTSLECNIKHIYVSNVNKATV